MIIRRNGLGGLLGILLMMVLCGCDYTIENREAVCQNLGTAEVYSIPLDSRCRQVARDTNGAVWVYECGGGGIIARTKIFDAPR